MMANPVNGEAVEATQKLLLHLKQAMPAIVTNLQQIAAISNDRSLPIILERMTLNKALHEPNTHAENIAKCPHIIALNETNTNFGLLLNEESAESPAISSDQAMSELLPTILGLMQEVFLFRIHFLLPQ